MCGITGFWEENELDASAERTLASMTAVLDHRGPDGRGKLLDVPRGLAFGHTRLTINDLLGGDQPLESRDGQVVLTVNGEFYDFKKHRARLMTGGERFVTKSDSEIAISLYQRCGLDFVEHLRGEFAFALYDKACERLVLVRDRFGIRPLFFHHRDGLLAWASEVKSLLEHPAIPRRLDRRAAVHQLMQTMAPGSSAFEGIEALQPGHMLIAQRRQGRLEVRTKRYWDTKFPTLEERREIQADAQEHIEQIRERLIEAVVLRLEADVPVGCYLSGGIDSCSILGLATGAQQSPVKAFTISFDHDSYDESAIAAQMAQSMEAEQETICLGADDLYGDNYLTTVWHSERTFYNTLGVAKWCMSRRVRECNYKTVVTGEGADELFAGYPAFRRDMILHGHDDGSPERKALQHQELERANRLFRGAILPEQSESHPAFEKLCGFTPSWIQPWLATLRQALPLVHPDLRRELDGYDPIEAIADGIDAEMLQGRHPLDKAQYTWIKTMLEGQILNWGGDRVDMANSMESRPAFLDHHLAEAALQVPPSLRIRDNREKWVLREAVKGVLPDVLYKRQKFAFMAPPAHTGAQKRARLRSLIEDHLDERSVERAGLLDARRVEEFLQLYWADDDPVSLVRKDTIVNHMLCLHILHDQFIEKNVPASAAAVGAGNAA